MAIDGINTAKPFAVPFAVSGDDLKSGVGAASDKEDIKKAAQDFEAIFINYMLKTMREGVSKSGLLHGGNAEEMYTSMMDEELSKAIAQKGGIGLGSILLKEFGMDKISTIVDQEGFAHEASKLIDTRPYVKMPDVGDNGQGSRVKGQEEPIADTKSPMFKSPIAGILSSGYGYRNDPFKQDIKFHHGVDIAAKEGTEVYPSAPGVVIFSGWKDGYGNMVEIRHNNGYVTRYGHNAKNLVKEGDNVDGNMPIAHVGSTGKSTGSHLHFEIKKDGVTQNPADFMSIG
ncbi:MAG: peptidoglycan DD-metalloendopeptidase family protein [Deltaproteobacteria bacterium]|nr:peptidoglycan DD-metalloendopeptidase family protein [Deltaproteobacteria bacterium]